MRRDLAFWPFLLFCEDMPWRHKNFKWRHRLCAPDRSHVLQTSEHRLPQSILRFSDTV